jgi:hypothetical protein
VPPVGDRQRTRARPVPAVITRRELLRGVSAVAISAALPAPPMLSPAAQACLDAADRWLAYLEADLERAKLQALFEAFMRRQLASFAAAANLPYDDVAVRLVPPTRPWIDPVR